MKQIIFCDIDGCLNQGKNVPLDIDTLTRIKALLPRLAARGVGFTLCTGRPQPYAEAIAQLLAIELPFVCEGGGLLYHPDTDRYRPIVQPEARAGIDALRDAVLASGILSDELFLEIGKSVSLCITGPYLARKGHDGIGAEMAHLRQRFSGFDVSWTHSNGSIDITPAGVSKLSGMRGVCADFGLDPGNAIGIGDSNGDLPMLSAVRQAFCPQNASTAVRALAGYVSDHEYALGTLDILQVIERRLAAA